MSSEAMQARGASASYLKQAEVQDVPPGYKQSEVGVIPKDWDVSPLDEFTSYISYGFTNPMPTSESGIYMITAKDIDQGRIQYDTARFTTEKAYRTLLSDKSRPEQYDLLLTKDGTLGRLALVDERVICINQSVAILRPNSKVVPEFLKLLLEAQTYQKRMLEDAGGSTIKHIYITVVNRMPVALPSSRTEQCAIAEALSDVDDLHGALEAIIAKKRAIKMAAMQQLLTGKTRLPGFSGEWETMRLGDHVTFLRNGVNSRAELTTDGPVKYLHYGDIHTSSEVRLDPRITAIPSLPQERARSLDRLQDGDLVFADASEDMDGVGRSVEIQGVTETEIVAGLHTIAARFDKTVLADGFKAYLQFSPAIRENLRRLAAGTKVYATNRSHIASVEMRLPSTKEQDAIATALSDMDAEIAALEARRDKTRALKQGMMQQLLTGRVRLV